MSRALTLSPMFGRRPLAGAVLLSLALHGAALAGAHFLLFRDPDSLARPLAEHMVAMVMIENSNLVSRATVSGAPAAQQPVRPPDRLKPAQVPRPEAITDPPEATKPVTRITRREDLTPAPQNLSENAAERIATRTTPAPIPAGDPATAPARQASLASATQGPDTTTTPPAFGTPGKDNPRPHYPWLSRQRGEEGRVVLRVGVDAQGHAVNVAIVASSGHGRLDRAAAEAVRNWRFTPARKAGRAVADKVDVPIRFRISED